MNELFPTEKQATTPQDLPYFDRPQDDNQRLLNCQYKWLVYGDKKAETELWLLTQKVARRMVKGIIARRHLRFSGAQVKERIDNAVFYVLRRFKDESGKLTGYAIRKAFLLAIKCGVIHAMDYTTFADKRETYADVESVRKMRRMFENEEAEERFLLVKGMTTAEAVDRIKNSTLFADEILEKVRIIGGKVKEHSFKIVLGEEQAGWVYKQAEEKGISCARVLAEILEKHIAERRLEDAYKKQ